MNTMVIRAHFDGKKIVLDEPIKLKPKTRLIITVLPKPESEQNDEAQEEREAWLQLSSKGLENAYGEVEGEYSLDLIKESNPDYDGR